MIVPILLDNLDMVAEMRWNEESKRHYHWYWQQQQECKRGRRFRRHHHPPEKLDKKLMIFPFTAAKPVTI